MAESIGVTATKHNLIQDANTYEVSKEAVSPLSRVVKASALCQEDKEEGPNGGSAAELADGAFDDSTDEGIDDGP